MEGWYTMGVRKNQVCTSTLYISRTSAKRDVTVKRISDTPAVNSVVIRMETGRKTHVAWIGKPVIPMITTRGISDSPRFTSPPPTTAATKTERGMNVRFAMSFEPWLCDAAAEVVWAK